MVPELMQLDNLAGTLNGPNCYLIFCTILAASQLGECTSCMRTVNTFLRMLKRFGNIVDSRDPNTDIVDHYS